jgi:hypothetical protein
MWQYTQRMYVLLCHHASSTSTMLPLPHATLMSQEACASSCCAPHACAGMQVCHDRGMQETMLPDEMQSTCHATAMSDSRACCICCHAQA